MFREFVGAKRRAIDERDRQVTLAWNTANLNAAASVGKLPKLETQLIKGATGQGRHSPHEHRAALEVLSQQFGIPLRKAATRAR